MKVIFFNADKQHLLRIILCFQCQQENFQNLVFPNLFDKNLIKCGKIVSGLMQYSKKICEMTRNLGVCLVQFQNPTPSKLCHSSYMVITLHNLKIFLSLLLLSHPTISKCYQRANWNFWGLVIPFTFSFLKKNRQKLWVNFNYYYQ